MKYIPIIRGIFNGIKDYYVLRMEYDFNRRKNHPVRMMLFDFSKALTILAFIVLGIMISTPAFRSIVNYTIETHTSYNTRISQLTKEVEDARTDMVNAAIRTIKQFKNPSFDGIKFCNVKGVYSVYPMSCSVEDKKVYYHLALWAKEVGYDTVIFGESYTGLNGTFYWSDGKNNQYDTDVELIINMLKEKGCKKIMSFISNQECKNYIPHVKNHVNGLFIISEVQNYRLEILSHKFWKTHKSVVIRSNNFSAEIIDNELNVASRPKGLKNITVVYNRQKKDFIQNIKDKSFITAKKIKAVINMADAIDG